MTFPISPTNPDIEQIRSMFQRVSTDSFYQELAEKFEIGLGSGIYSPAVVGSLSSMTMSARARLD